MAWYVVCAAPPFTVFVKDKNHRTGLTNLQFFQTIDSGEWKIQAPETILVKMLSIKWKQERLQNSWPSYDQESTMNDQWEKKQKVVLTSTTHNIRNLN